MTTNKTLKVMGTIYGFISYEMKTWESPDDCNDYTQVFLRDDKNLSEFQDPIRLLYGKCAVSSQSASLHSYTP